MRDHRKSIAWNALCALAAACLCACAIPASAQDAVADYSLPPASQPPTAPVAGPVDAENPVIAPSAPPSAPAPNLPSPGTAAAGASPAGTPAIAADAAATVAQSAASRGSAQAPAAGTPGNRVAASESVEANVPVPAVARSADRPNVPHASGAPEAVSAASLPWAATGGLAALAMALLAVTVWARRTSQALGKDAGHAETIQRRETDQPPLEPSGTASPSPVANGSFPLPSPAFASTRLGFDCVAVSLQLSLVYATLNYRISLANSGHAAIGPMSIAGDLISAHASLGRQWQLDPDERFLIPLHRLECLASGDHLALDGQLRLPLADVVAIEAGNARFLAPLARFVILAGPLREARILTFGEAPGRPGGALVPLRLDAGPRLFRNLEVRPVGDPRAMALDPARRAR